MVARPSPARRTLRRPSQGSEQELPAVRTDCDGLWAPLPHRPMRRPAA